MTSLSRIASCGSWLSLSPVVFYHNRIIQPSQKGCFSPNQTSKLQGFLSFSILTSQSYIVLLSQSSWHPWLVEMFSHFDPWPWPWLCHDRRFSLAGEAFQRDTARGLGFGNSRTTSKFAAQVLAGRAAGAAVDATWLKACIYFVEKIDNQ